MQEEPVQQLSEMAAKRAGTQYCDSLYCRRIFDFTTGDCEYVNGGARKLDKSSETKRAQRMYDVR